MTYEEALQSVLSYCVEECGKIDTCRTKNPNCVEAVVIQALEKQIPKKPKKRVRGVYSDDSNDWLYDEEWDRCPTCRKDKEVYKGWDYCPLCGQAIDWSDDE